MIVDSFSVGLVYTKLKFAWLPKRCYFSNKRIWLEFAYVQKSVDRFKIFVNPNRRIQEIRWYEKHEFLIAKIKGVL